MSTILRSTSRSDLLISFVEVVLSILVESFKFLPSGKEIVWNRAGVNYPTAGSASNTPSLPMRVERVKI